MITAELLNKRVGRLATLASVVTLLSALFFALSPSTQAATPADMDLDEFREVVTWADGTLFTLPLGVQADNFRVPEDNPMTKEKVALGKLLFFDVRLSENNTVSCATCHAPDKGFADSRPLFRGIHNQKGGRNSPTVINRAFSEDQFWDGRAPSLEEQAKVPITSPTEMGMPSSDAVVAKLKKIKGYRKLFRKVFGDDINFDDLVKAIAAFERTVISGGSNLDRYNMGDDSALGESETRGLQLFRGKARCNQCHAGFNFTDEVFHNIGVGMEPTPKIDLGRFSVTKKSVHIAAFKTPTLRDITKTAPYMHDGRFDTLEQVIDFYNDGGVPNPFLDREIFKLNLNKREKRDIIAFLRALDGTGWTDIKPPTKIPVR